MAASKYLVVKGNSGFGNRIQVALDGLVYARLSGRELVVDWSDPVCSQDGSNAFHRFFDCPSHSAMRAVPVTDSVHPAVWRGLLHKDLADLRRTFHYDPSGVVQFLAADISKLDYKEDVVVLAGYTSRLDELQPHFPGRMDRFLGKPKTAILRTLVRDELSLQPAIRERVQQFKRDQFASATVGVHARFSDRRGSLLGLIRQLNALLRAEPQLRIFLSTDNIEVRDAFARSYSNLTTTPHWYPPPGEPVHLSKSAVDRTENAIESLVDLYLLAECDYMIYDGTSSFSRMANLLRKAPKKQTFDVRTGREPSRAMRGRVTRWMRRIGLYSWGPRLLARVVPLRKL